MDETDWEEEEKWEGRNTKFFIPLSLQEEREDRRGDRFQGKEHLSLVSCRLTTEFHACREKGGSGGGTHRLG